jgi:MFS family permease
VITLIFFGSLLGNLVLAIIGDMMGRKALMLFSLFFQLFGLVLTIECSSLIMAGIGLFMAYAGVQSCYTICFYFIAETMEEEMRSKISVGFQLFGGLGVLLNPFWFTFMADWQLILTIFYFIPSIFLALGVIFIVKDTPICLILRNSP